MSPPPLPQRPQEQRSARVAVDVWEYLGDGLWGSMGQAFPEVGTDPFWIMLLRITPWFPGGKADLSSLALEEESGYTPLPTSA